MTDDGDRQDGANEGQEALPAHLAALVGGVDEARETVDFRGFIEGQRPEATPFAVAAQVSAKSTQPDLGLPFQRDGEAAPAAALPAQPAKDFRAVDTTFDLPGPGNSAAAALGTSPQPTATSQAASGQAPLQPQTHPSSQGHGYAPAYAPTSAYASPQGQPADPTTAAPAQAHGAAGYAGQPPPAAGQAHLGAGQGQPAYGAPNHLAQPVPPVAVPAAVPPHQVAQAPVSPAGAEAAPAAASPWVDGSAQAPAAAKVSPADYYRPPNPLAEKQPGGIPQLAVPAHDQPSVPAAEVEQPKRTGELVQLVWYDPYSVARIRRKPDWGALLQELEEHYDEELDDPDYSDEPADVEERREVYEILTRGRSTEPETMRTILLEGIRQGGKVKLPLLLVEGELRFDFDELSELGAVVSTASPYAHEDKALAAVIDDADAFLESARPPVAPKVCRAFTERVRTAFLNGEGERDEEFFDEQVSRALLTGKCYQLRDVLGERHVRAGYRADGKTGDGKDVPCYLPEDVAPELPMFRSFRAAMIAELNLREDQYENHPAALRVLAIARVMKTPGAW